MIPYPTDINQAVRDGTHLRLSHSSMGVLSTCTRKFEFRKLYPASQRENSFPADVGQALHRAYQEYLTNRDKTKARMELIIAYPQAARYVMPDEYGFVSTSVYSELRSFWACLSTLEAMMQEEFINHFRLARILNSAGEVVPAIEVPFEIRFPGVLLGKPDSPMTVSYVGYIDAIMQHKTTGVYRTVDIKTHRANSKRRDAEFVFNGQQLPYGLVLQHILNRPIDKFEVHYFDCYISLARPRAENWVFTKTQAQVQEWLTGLIIKLRNLNTYMKMDFFPRAEHGCLAYQRPCYYLDLCHLRNREKLLRLWKPGKANPRSSDIDPWILCDLDIPVDSIGQ